MINANSFRDKAIASVLVGYDWHGSMHFAEIQVSDGSGAVQTYRLEGLSDFSINEDFAATHVSHCTFINTPERVYLSLDPYNEGTESEHDNYTFVCAKIDTRR